MINVEHAKDTALALASATCTVPLAILDDRTIEREFGWVFFYQSKQFVVDGIDSASLYGAAPVIVNRHTGRATLTGTSFPIEDYIEAYEALGAERFEAGEWREFLRSKIQSID